MVDRSLSLLISTAAAIGLALAGCRPGAEETATPSRPAAPSDSSEVAAPLPGDAAQSARNLPQLPGVDTDQFTTDLNHLLDEVDPLGTSDWSNEDIAAEISGRLGDLAHAVVDAGLSGFRELKRFSASEVAIAIPQRADLEEVWRTDTTVVRRLPSDWKPETTTVSLARFESDIGRWFERVFQDAESHLKFKLYRVTKTNESEIQAHALVEAWGERQNSRIERHGDWELGWRNREGRWELNRLVVRVSEETSPGTASPIRFVDRTADVFHGVEAFDTQLSQGIDYWRSRLQGRYGIDTNGLQGIAVGDANGDGLDDLYLCQQGGAPNKLFLRQRAGDLIDFSEESGADWMELSRAALFVDLDNDGDQDLAIAQGWYLMLMENDGSARFTPRLEEAAPALLHSVAAADYDNDGHLDLFFCGRNPRRELEKSEGILGTPIPYHDANNGGPSLLIRNLGDWRYQDVTRSVGLDVNNRRYSYAASWEDFDNDGDQDLYVANDFGRNNLYRNDMDSSGAFVDVADELGVEDISAGMSVTWGDYDRDAWMDVYVSNMFSSAGNRVAYQREFRDDFESDRSAFQRHARGNTLFRNAGNDEFQDVSVDLGVTMGRWAWGAKFADFDNDGWEDLYVANGFITTEDTGDL